MLSASHISKSHGPNVVLADVTVSVGPRSRIGVVGPNGVGKTTLLRILAGLDEPDAGAVARAPADLAVGYLPQEPDAVSGETVRAYLARRTGVAGAEAAMQAAADAMAAEPGDESVAHDYAAGLDRWLRLGGGDFEARAEEVATDVGLPGERLDVEVASLSGGQAARAALAAILLSRYDVLLLDEPSNNLDFAGLDQLADFVLGAPGGLVVVSHDRDFLARTIDRVLEIDEHSRSSTEFGGGWAGYLEARATARRHAEEAYGEYSSERERLSARLREQRSWAEQGTKTAKKQKANQRERMAADFKINRTEKQASKVRITEKALARLETVEKPWEGWDLRMDLAPSKRSGDIVARLDEAVMRRGSFTLGPVSVEIGWAERVAILGPNGCGKTTLLRALLGDLPLESGQRYLGPGVVVGELDQARRRFEGDVSLLDAFSATSGMLPREARSLLAKFGLGSEHVARTTDRLSPGERTRAVLAALMAGQVNCLVLDEPTNHLDLPAIEQLEAALDRYEGTVLMVTHDRALLESVRITRTIEL